MIENIYIGLRLCEIANEAIILLRKLLGRSTRQIALKAERETSPPFVSRGKVGYVCDKVLATLFTEFSRH